MQQYDELAEGGAEYAIFKIKSLSNHRKCLDLPRDPLSSINDCPLEEEKDENRPGLWTQIGDIRIPSYMLSLEVPKPEMPEAFNTKVDDTRKRQMPALWCPWF